MKSKFLFVAVILFLAHMTVYAQSEIFINYFTVPKNMAQPVTVITNLGTYTFSGTYVIYGRIEKIEVFNINGERIEVDKPRIKEGITATGASCVEYYYSFTKFYKGSSSYVFEGQDSREHNPYYFSSGVGEVKGFMAKNYKDWRRKTYIGTGYGTQYGGARGVSVTAKTASGLLGLAGGVGYDERLSEKSFPTWYAALLMGWKGWDIEIGPVSRYRPEKYCKDFGLVLMTNASIPIYGPFGINAGIGYFLSFHEKNPTPFLEWNVGLTVRLHQAK